GGPHNLPCVGRRIGPHEAGWSHRRLRTPPFWARLSTSPISIVARSFSILLETSPGRGSPLAVKAKVPALRSRRGGVMAGPGPSRRPGRRPASLDPDARGLDDALPLGSLAAQERGDLGGRAAFRNRAELLDRVAQLRLLHGGVHLSVEMLDDRLRRSGRRQQ